MMNNKKLYEKCSYLGCHNKAIIQDNVEVAPNVIEKKKVCKKHKGQLVGNIESIGKK